jgi:predicted transcriptional regulator
MPKPGRSQRDRIYSYIRRRPRSGATRKELCRNLEILHQSVGPRVVELLEAGKVAPTGEYREDCEVLVAVDVAHDRTR